MPHINGQIISINSELKYGFIANANIGKIFFSPETIYNGVAFEDLRIDEKVSVEVKETPRGFMATTLERIAAKQKKYQEASL